MNLLAIALSVFLLMLGLHYAKKLCKKDRSFVCTGFTGIAFLQTLSSPVPPVPIAQEYGRCAECARAGLGTDIFHPPCCFLSAV